MMGRKLAIALVAALICNLASGQVSNPRNLKVLCFGNSSHIMFVDFKEAIDTSAVLKTAPWLGKNCLYWLRVSRQMSISCVCN